MHREDEPVAPLGVYGQSKAAGDARGRGTAPRHYVLRTSWVIGDGNNFVRTMASLADRGISPSVVDDQLGRLTFADELARATVHLLATGAPYGTYNVTNGGPATSWAEIAREVFRLGPRPRGRDRGQHGGVLRRQGRAPRPRHSAFDLTKLEATGFTPTEARTALASYTAGSSDRA